MAKTHIRHLRKINNILNVINKKLVLTEDEKNTLRPEDDYELKVFDPSDEEQKDIQNAPWKQYQNEDVVSVFMDIKRGALDLTKTSTEKAYEILDDLESVNEITAEVSEIVVNLTNVKNYLDELGAEKEDIERVDAIRYISSNLIPRLKKNNKTIREHAKLVEQFEKKISSQEYTKALEQAIQSVKEQYGIAELEDSIGKVERDLDTVEFEDNNEMQQIKQSFEALGIEIEDAKEDIHGNVQEMEQKSKDAIRSIIEIIEKYYTLNDTLLKNAQFKIIALGQVLSISKEPKTSVRLSPKGMKILMKLMEKNSKLKDILEPHIVKQTKARQVNIVGTSISKIGTIYAKFISKLKRKADDIGNKTNIDEGLFTQATIKTKKMVVTLVVEFIDSIRLEQSKVNTTVNKMNNYLIEKIDSLNDELQNDNEEFQKAIDEFKEKKKENELEALRIENKYKEKDA